MRLRARRRSVSICVSPGPLVPMPPPSRSRWLQRPRMRAMLYSSCASSSPCSRAPTQKARCLARGAGSVPFLEALCAMRPLRLLSIHLQSRRWTGRDRRERSGGREAAEALDRLDEPLVGRRQRDPEPALAGGAVDGAGGDHDPRLLEDALRLGRRALEAG